MVCTTASASSLSPLEKVTPGRSLKSHVIGSRAVHDSASAPRTAPSGPTAVSASKTLLHTYWPGAPTPLHGTPLGGRSATPTLRIAGPDPLGPALLPVAQALSASASASPS